MPDVFMVNFLIAGTQKGGTAALMHFLFQHPEICMAPCKEVHLFDSNNYNEALSPDEINKIYKNSFPNYKDQEIIGEATPDYMYHPIVAKRIMQYNPHMKIILLLRNPIERASSHYGMRVRKARESLPFILAILIEMARLWFGKHNYTFIRPAPRYSFSYLDRGFYSKQLMNLYKYFPKEQILIINSDMLLKDHANTIKTVYNFLGIKDMSFIPKHELLKMTQIKYKPSIFESWLLNKIFHKEIIKLENMLGWDLTSWKSPARPIDL